MKTIRVAAAVTFAAAVGCSSTVEDPSASTGEETSLLAQAKDRKADGNKDKNDCVTDAKFDLGAWGKASSDMKSFWDNKGDAKVDLGDLKEAKSAFFDLSKDKKAEFFDVSKNLKNRVFDSFEAKRDAFLDLATQKKDDFFDMANTKKDQVEFKKEDFDFDSGVDLSKEGFDFTKNGVAFKKEAFDFKNDGVKKLRDLNDAVKPASWGDDSWGGASWGDDSSWGDAKADDAGQDDGGDKDP